MHAAGAASPFTRDMHRGSARVLCGRRPRRVGGNVCSQAGRGFSLLEVLVAFIIVALVVTALFRLFGGALGNASAADEWTRALLVAQSRLALAASVEPLRETNDAGTESDGRISWRTSVAPYVPADANPDLERLSETMPTRLYRVTVDVQFPGIAGQARTLSLSTVKVGPRNPA
jgi:general secretion pathway protein I